MNKLEFLNEMDRVLAFWQRPDEKKQPGEFKDYNTWLDEIFKKISWIDASKFTKVIDGLMDVRPRFRKDLDHRRIVAVYNDIAEQSGWTKAETKNCGSCLGARFVYIWVRDKKGLEFKAMKGCGNCNKRYSTVHQDFTEIDAPFGATPTIDTEKLKTIPPSFASFLLSVAERTEPRPKESIVEALVEATCQADAGRRPGSQPGIKTIAEPIKNPVKQRNEMVKKFIEAPPARVVEPEPELVAVAAPAEEIPFEPEKVNPNVAHIPKEQREKWSKDEPGEEEIPF